MSLSNSGLELFWHWIRERESIRIKRESGQPWPWSDEDAFRQNHFCNVRREDDRVTKELRALALKSFPNREDIKFLPMYYTVARMFNHAPSVEYVMQHGWDEAIPHFEEMMQRGEKVFHTAYVVSTCGQRISKPQYCASVARAVAAANVPMHTLAAAYDALRQVNGLGSFMAGQVVADLKNDRYLIGAEDWFVWATIGPGSKKGLDYLFGGGTSPLNFMHRMSLLVDFMPDDIYRMNLHMQDLQNCLCEFSKYVRIVTGGKGRKRNFNYVES